jgi:adenylosuccinate lyase
MNTETLKAISPIDGRYSNHTRDLVSFFSEYALIKYRVKVEAEYFTALCRLPLPQLRDVTDENLEHLKKIADNFSPEDAWQVKEIEKITNHDVKAVEYFIKERLKNTPLEKHSEFIHFGLTSQDINNTAVPLSIKESMEQVYIPLLGKFTAILEEKSLEWKDVPMLARTHGQPASPTKLGKEIEVFTTRIARQMKQLDSIPYSAKFGGATGNFNAHYVAYPQTNWHAFADDFLQKQLGLSRSFPTTQIEHYDNIAALFDLQKRINTILTDFSRDMWSYISMEYFRQKIKKNEVGSSAMPHKVNPIDFENAEGNLGIANALFSHLSAKLPISRLQRDLTDSTVLRNIGTPIGHTVIALKSLIKGMGKLILNQHAIERDLNNNWAVVAEAIQTILRREGYPKPYEALKELTRTNKPIDKELIISFIDGLDISKELKEELALITPYNYTGN